MITGAAQDIVLEKIEPDPGQLPCPNQRVLYQCRILVLGTAVTARVSFSVDSWTILIIKWCTPNYIYGMTTHNISTHVHAQTIQQCIHQ